MSDPHSPDDSGPSGDPQAKPNSGFLYAAAKYTGIASALPGATIGGYVIGYLLDKWLGTSYLKIVFLILGIVAGFLELIRQLLHDMNAKK